MNSSVASDELDGGVVAEQVISSAEDLTAFLRLIQGKMDDEGAAPIFCLSAINKILAMPQVYDYLTDLNRELARELWLRIRQSGLQIRAPRLLFSEEESKTHSDQREDDN